MTTHEIKISIKADNLLEKQTKEEILQNLAELPTDVLEKLNLMRTEKAINALRKKWGLIKSFI